ncbi:TonB-dependent receptor plug domain-containing protein [Altererythrobacter sp. B11]|uniref:TonB-dependent receptor plug domain-containing protein n=1 Tax=Altererythrobacter sp. B11 TaxID=2060312 RepID=UPI001558E63C|nr:Plug domain-containing protein [Altererythrobacter sp. B11]
MKYEVTRVRRGALRAALLATVSLSVPAMAQTPPTESQQPASTEQVAAPPQDATTFGDIVVTAQKRSQRTQDIALSITAIGGDQLKQQNINTISDIATLVPGFTVAKSFRGPPIYTLRGVGFNTPNMLSSPHGVDRLDC